MFIVKFVWGKPVTGYIGYQQAYKFLNLPFLFPATIIHSIEFCYEVILILLNFLMKYFFSNNFLNNPTTVG